MMMYLIWLLKIIDEDMMDLMQIMMDPILLMKFLRTFL